MGEHTNRLNDLAEIRLMMERSSRFLTLSGLSGVFAGIYALIGAGAAYFYFSGSGHMRANYYDRIRDLAGRINMDVLTFCIADALIVLALSLATGYYFTMKKTRKSNHKMWNAASKRMLASLSIPLAAGGLYCGILFMHGKVGLIAPATLIFYGLALISAGKYTLDEIKYLGVLEIVLGLLASVFPGYGLIAWAFGFGVLHIIYGLLMYSKYDRKAVSE